MKTIIAGSRKITSYELLLKAIAESGFVITSVISGTAEGVDSLGERWASENNLEVKKMPAQWGVYGKSAGYKRNKAMAFEADALIALWDGESKGTKHMIEIARSMNLKVYVKNIMDLAHKELF